MKRLKLVLVISMVLAVALLMFGTTGADEGKCPFCGMKIEGNENTAYEITFNDGKKETFCCPHCGLSAHASNKANVRSARAKDFISGEWMDPAKMLFIADSTAVPACAPSWIAFASREEAEKFMKGFGGKIYSFEEALTERAKQPKGMEMKH